MTAVATAASHELVDIEALGKYAMEQWDLGDKIADEAGEPYWVRGAEALEKAKRTVMALGKETFGEYQERVTGRDESTCRRHRQAFLSRTKLLEDATKARNDARRRISKIPTTIRGLTGQSKAGQSHMTREWTPEVDAQAKHAFREQVKREIDTKAKEAEAEKALAKRLIDIGYRVLSKELHPDAGGSHDAMVRLREVKRRLYRSFSL